ncbi:hypothetical protein HDU67_006873 [Dinochytrium kinnereticum]|nr:hypothetical protein HDU67_006873 [Dinochytrium kinnereticum]
MTDMQRLDDDGQAGNDDDMDMIEPASPVMELDETIDYSLVYALHTFVANLEGQVCVLKGDSLELLDDSNSYWWLVKCIKTDEIGYIPAENVETPFERLARLNKIRNVQLASINAHDAEEGDKIPPPNRRGITFSENHEIFEDYDLIEGEEEEGGEYEEEEVEEVVVSPTEPQAATTGIRSRDKVQSLSLGQNFLKKLLGRNSMNRKEKPSKADGNSLRNSKSPTSEKPNMFQTVVDAQAQEESSAQKAPEPINVLRIYAGNVDLKATFKSVAISKDITVGELLESALKRFRVPGANASEFYLSVLHLDSQEKRLPESDNVFQMLEELRRKQLPGVSLKAGNGGGRVGGSTVQMNDDKIIKVIINKKLNLFEKNYHLIRIFMQDESDVSGKIKTYKTIGINSDAKVADIVEIALKKFKLPADPNFLYTLCSVFKGTEIPRNPAESILDILVMAEGSPEDIDLILRKEWLGEGSMPRSVTMNADSGPATVASFQAQGSKPSFLEDLPMSPSQGSMMSANAGNDMYQNSLSKPISITSPLSKDFMLSLDNGANASTSITGGEPANGSQRGSAEVENGNSSKSNSWLGGVLNSLDFNNGGASNGSFQSNNSGQPTPSSVPARSGSASSWSPPSPPEDNDMDKARKQVQQPAFPESEEAGVQSRSSLDDKSGTGNVFWTGPPGVVPPRKGSLTDASVPRRLLAEYANAHPEISEADEAAASRSADTRRPSSSELATNEAGLDGKSVMGVSSSSPTPAGATSNAAIKANFEYMEEYLEEIMKDSIDSTKLEALETALRKNSVEPGSSGKSSLANSSESIGPYTDSGLSQMLRSQRSQPELRRPSADGLGLTPPASSSSSSINSSRLRSNSSNPIPTTRLRDMYDDIEKDLEKSLSVNSNPASRKKASATNGDTPITPPSSSPQPGGLSMPTASRNAKSDPNLSSAARPVLPNIVTDKPGALGAGKRSESDSAVVTPLSARIDPSDPMSAIERFREAELMLNAMQRDLDSLLASAVNAFQVTETIYARS